MDQITVRANWDQEAGVWVASSEDADGIALEAPTVEQLREKVMGAIADLIELNQIPASRLSQFSGLSLIPAQ